MGINGNPTAIKRGVLVTPEMVVELDSCLWIVAICMYCNENFKLLVTYNVMAVPHNSSTLELTGFSSKYEVTKKIVLPQGQYGIGFSINAKMFGTMYLSRITLSRGTACNQEGLSIRKWAS